MDPYSQDDEVSLDSFDPVPSNHRRTPSPPSFPSPMFMKRANPKRLSLTLTMPTVTAAPPLGTPTPTYSTESTPYTPGPPKTPALATASLGRLPSKASRRPSLLTLNTQTTNPDEVAPTPGGNIPYFNGRPPARTRLRSSTEIREDGPSYPSAYRPDSPPLNPLQVAGWRDRKEHSLTLPAYSTSYQSSSSDTSSHTSSSSSSASTPSSSPPLHSFGVPLCSRPEPYSCGPVEVVPNVFLGAEDSATDLTWARRFKSLRVINVAQEIENPYAGASAKGKGKVALGRYEAVNGVTDVEYCHLRWSHGESGLAEMPAHPSLSELIDHPKPDLHSENWGIWNAVKWMEEARRADVPVLIHCQCGISRSATLLIAYLMCLAAAGLLPEHLGHLSGMQDTYDFVKRKSPCIGPNVSLIFQLVELQRALTALLSEHISQPLAKPIDTAFPTLAAQALSEAEWARKRADFEDEESGKGGCAGADGMLISPLSPEEAGDEARRLDQAMMDRIRQRE